MQIESIEDNERNLTIIEKIKSYFSRIELQRHYKTKLSEDDNVLIINLDHLRVADPDLWTLILSTPLEQLKTLETVATDTIKEAMVLEGEDPDYFDPPRISFEGNLGKQTVTPRGLKSGLMHKLVKLQGIVTSVTKVKFRLLKSTHYCETTKRTIHKEYNDVFSLRMNDEGNVQSSNNIPTHDPNGNPLVFEHGLSNFKNIQKAIIQEMPENIPSGLLSRSVEVLLQEDLVDKLKPGERVQIIGVPRPTATARTNANCIFKVTLMAIGINKLKSIDSDGELTPQERRDIQSISKRPDLLPLMRRSLAPAIAGHDGIKEALLLLLLGGCEKKLENGTKIRGDVNVLLVGDPSTAKSQFLRRVLNIANLAFSTTGRGSTGVGLTAAITMDKDSGEKSLEAGAMVLADRGVICVDEFDKMTDEDRVAMHEAMEQQTVTISKAGINVSLNARCSVLAAANPIYSEYDPTKSVSFNIGLRDTLLSRFDLIFIVLDEKNAEKDRMIAERVTANHRFGGQTKGAHNFSDGTGVVEAELVMNDKEHAKPFEQFNALLHLDKKTEYLRQPFIKKFISFVKATRPKFTDTVKEVIVNKWCLLREHDHRREKEKIARIRPVDIRTLDSLIRLSHAYAKLRLSPQVEIVDGLNALNLFINVYYGGVRYYDPKFFAEFKEYVIDKELGARLKTAEDLKKPKSKKRMKVEKKEEEEKNEPEPSRAKRRKRQKKEGMVVEETPIESKKKAKKKKMLFKVMYDFKNDSGKSFIDIKLFKEYVIENFPNAERPDVRFSKKEIDRLAKELCDKDSKIVIDNEEGKYYMI